MNEIIFDFEDTGDMIVLRQVTYADQWCRCCGALSDDEVCEVCLEIMGGEEWES